ncbi:MAG: uroporphyrinogen decarboxylase family protein [Spirochaetota bacterium]
MSSRERVLSAIDHREADRVPIDMGSTPSSGISAVAYDALKQHLGITSGSTQIYDVVQYLAQPEWPIIDRLGVDVLDIGRAMNSRESDWRDTTMPNGRPAQYPSWFVPRENSDGTWIARHRDGTPIAAMPKGAVFFDQTFFPWIEGYPDSRSAMNEALDEAMDHVMWAHLVHSPWDRGGEPDFWTTLREETLKLRDTTDKALLVVCGCNLFEWGTFLRRMDNFLMDLYTDEENVGLLMELLMERHLATLEKVCESVGDIVDIVRFGDDLGMDSGPFMGLDVYRRSFHAHRTRLCDYVHQHSSMHTYLHTCGSVYQYIPDLIESGIEIINPVQTNCRDMEPERLKSEFGTDIVFWGGGVDPREVLNRGTPQDVRDDVRRRLDILAPGGGFVFNTIHNILSEVPPENVIALFDTVMEYTDE